MRGAKLPYPEPYKSEATGGKFHFMFRDPRTGKRRKKSTGKTSKTEAIKFIKAYIDELSRNTNEDGEKPFREYAACFFIDGECPRQQRMRNARKSFGARHMRDMRQNLERVIGRPANGRKKARKSLPFADLKLSMITRSDIYDLQDKLSRSPGGRSGQLAFQAVKTVLSEATERGVIERSPADGIGAYKRPEAGSGEKGEEKRRAAFNYEEYSFLWQNRNTIAKPSANGIGWGRIVDGADDDPRHVMTLSLLLALGVRVSELRALRWRHVNLETGTIDIVEAFKGGNAGDAIGLPKWGKTRPGLKIPVPLIGDLKTYRQHMETRDTSLVRPDTFIICNPEGGPVGETFVQKTWKTIKKNTGDSIGWTDRWLTPHSCRHTLNTLLLINEAPPLQIQTFLGWESAAGKALAEMQRGYMVILKWPERRKLRKQLPKYWNFQKRKT